MQIYFILEKSEIKLNKKEDVLPTIIMMWLRDNRILKKPWRGFIIEPKGKFPVQKMWHSRNKGYWYKHQANISDLANLWKGLLWLNSFLHASIENKHKTRTCIQLSYRLKEDKKCIIPPPTHLWYHKQQLPQWSHECS